MSLSSIPRALSVEFLNDEKLTFRQKITYIFSHITLEPLVLLYATATVLSHITTQNLHLEKACRVNLAYNSTICDAINARDTKNYEQIHETQVQQLVSKVLAFRAVCLGSIAPILMLFFGSWSDRHGRRKPVILIPLFGETLSQISLLICSYFYLEIPIEGGAISESLFNSLCGSWFCFFLGVYSYVSGLSSENDRTLRIGAISMCQSFGISVGIFLSGFLIRTIGFKGVYCISIAMMFISIPYAIISVKDNKIIQEVEKSFLSDFFDFKNVKNTLGICFKKGSSNRKKKMIILMIISILISGPFYGEMTVVYMFTRLKFQWNEIDYSFYNTAHFLIQLIGNFTALIVLAKHFKLDDAALGIVAAISKLLSGFIYALGPTWPYFYFGAFVEIFYGTNGIALRSLMAKIVPPNELGQSNSIFGVCEALLPLAFGPLFSFIYKNTINFYPSAFYFVSAVLYVIALGLFIWMYRINKKEEKIRKITEKNLEQEENLLKKACLHEMKKSMEKLKSTHSLTN